ncbi:unnamed protein product [Cylicocyclus nassatus]|uniref:G-protein coupled receptors family 1 profile domain-containing protein n=1 Tax=Cylicocyclus nassatus TaxID=53992 RepID=A0AA36H5B7_CYLNA|nr:unnamed protein product [Cylicocyclus nassatus]
MSSNATAELVPMPMVVATMAFSIVGFIGNGLIIIATIMSRHLRNRCSILICILAMADFTICAYLIQLRVQMFRRWYFHKNVECFMQSFYGLFALNIQAGIGLVIGIDRLFAVTFPIRYSRLPKALYVTMVLFVLIYAALLTFYGYLDASDNIVPICLPPTAFNSRSRAVWIGSNVVIAFLVIMVYSTAHVKCHRLSAKNTHEQSVERIRRLLHSLSIVMGIYISTWFVTVLALLVTQIFPLNPKVVNEINQQLGWLVIINASMNFFVYLWRAPEYRKVFMYILCLNRSRTLIDGTMTISPASGTSTFRKSSTKNNAPMR